MGKISEERDKPVRDGNWELRNGTGSMRDRTGSVKDGKDQRGKGQTNEGWELRRDN